MKARSMDLCLREEVRSGNSEFVNTLSMRFTFPVSPLGKGLGCRILAALWKRARTATYVDSLRARWTTLKSDVRVRMLDGESSASYAPPRNRSSGYLPNRGKVLRLGAGAAWAEAGSEALAGPVPTGSRACDA